MNRFLNRFSKKSIYIAKPTKVFWILSLITFFIWLKLGPLAWRNVDDYGPIEQLFSDKITFFTQIKYLPYWFWGSYPPIWHFWAFPSYIFKDISIDLTRYILLLQGFLSIIFSSLLVSTICQILIVDTLAKKDILKINNLRLISDSLSISIVASNPQIMIHSKTYMPYHLGYLSSIFILLIGINFSSKISSKLINNKCYFKISYKIFLISTIISSFFIFQSFFIILPSLIISIYLNNSNNFEKLNLKDVFKDLRFKFNLKFNMTNIFFKISLPILFLGYSRKLIILFKSDVGTGVWAYGINNVYRLNEGNNNILIYLKKVLFSTINIFGQSFYNYRDLQLIFSVFIFILILISTIYLFKKSENYKFFIYFFLSNYILAIIFGTFTSVNYSPTRHNIYLLVYPALILISMFLNIIKKLDINNKNNKNFLLIILIFIFNFNMIGLLNSHYLIQYSKANRAKIIKMAESSDYFIDLNHLLINNSPGFFQSHGDKESNALKEKACNLQRIIDSNQSEYTAFFYSNSEKFDFNNKKTRQYLENHSRGCIRGESNISIIEKIELSNKKGLEQNNFIYNIGSPLNAYILKIIY